MGLILWVRTSALICGLAVTVHHAWCSGYHIHHLSSSLSQLQSRLYWWGADSLGMCPRSQSGKCEIGIWTLVRPALKPPALVSTLRKTPASPPQDEKYMQVVNITSLSDPNSESLNMDVNRKIWFGVRKKMVGNRKRKIKHLPPIFVVGLCKLITLFGSGIFLQ